MIRRRDLITLLTGAAAWPLAARAQQPDRMRRIGVLTPMLESDPEARLRRNVFEEGLKKVGWIEGRNLKIDYRWTVPDLDSIRADAAELVDLEKDGIGVAVDEDLLYFLHVSGLLALAPELVAAAAEVDDAPGAYRLLEGLAVHPRQHQHLAGRGVLGDGGNEAAGFVEIERAHVSIGPG